MYYGNPFIDMNPVHISRGDSVIAFGGVRSDDLEKKPEQRCHLR
jgi:hypothetical protein